jgi:hypothetical protein
MDFKSGAIHGGVFFLIWLVETKQFPTVRLMFYTPQIKHSTNSYEKKSRIAQNNWKLIIGNQQVN